MSSTIQLDMFEKPDAISLIKQEIEQDRKQMHNIRRGLFARHEELHKMYKEQNEEIKKLKAILYENISSTRMGDKSENIFMYG